MGHWGLIKFEGSVKMLSDRCHGCHIYPPFASCRSTFKVHLDVNSIPEKGWGRKKKRGIERGRRRERERKRETDFI